MATKVGERISCLSHLMPYPETNRRPASNKWTGKEVITFCF